MSSDLNTLQTRLEQLEADNAQMKADNASFKVEVVFIQAQTQRERRRLRFQAGLAFCSLLGAIFLSPTNRAAIAQGYGVTLASLNTRVMAVEAKTQFQFADANARSTTFSGCNVFVNNGLGATNGNPASPTNPFAASVNGLGNLILGYNEERGNNQDARTGSHNLIVGNQNNYGSYGGIVAGLSNTISAPFASVNGGYFNTASGLYAFASGGNGNTASAAYAVVCGGSGNTANGFAAAVSAGSFNTSSGNYAAVSGGQGNMDIRGFASVSGGIGNTASGVNTAVSGGDNNTASGINAAVSGGHNIHQGNDIGWAAGGNGAAAYHSP